MRHVVTLVLIAVGLFAVGIACGDGDDAPAATDTPATPANAATATVAIELTALPVATATLLGPTSTPRPDVEGPCPIDDETFCEFAEVIGQSIQRGDVETVIVNTELSSQTCSGLAQVGPCFGVNEGVVLSGFLVGVDASDSISYVNATNYLQLLDALVATDPAAVDEYGTGAWKLVAVVDEGPDMRVLVTTSIDNDPIANEPVSDRRVFLFRLERVDDTWRISILLTTVFRDLYLNGQNPDGSPFADWLPWGEE